MKFAEYKSRVKKSCEAVSEAEHDFLYVTNLASLRWLTGFAGSAASLLLSPTSITLFVDSRYEAYAADLVESEDLSEIVDVVFVAKKFEKIRSMTADHTVACEAGSISAGEYQELEQAVGSTTSLLLRGTNEVERLRNQKDSSEVELTRKALAIAEEAFAVVEDSELPLTEKELQRKLDAQMIALGADRPAFETIVASGVHSTQPHSKPTDKVIVPGELVIIDWGAEVEGYRSDTSRTIWWGQLDASKQKIYSAVYESFMHTMSRITVGVSYGAVMREAKEILKKNGLDRYIQHPFGHNVGLEIHERPFFSETEEAKIEEGSLLAFEPAVYVPELGGVRLENMLYIGPKGTEILNTLPSLKAAC